MSAILLAAGLGSGLIGGTPAEAATATSTPATSLFNGTCQVWTDAVTFGTDCTGLTNSKGSAEYRAVAYCNGDGGPAIGTYVVSGWSYAYCSTYSSTISSPQIEIYWGALAGSSATQRSTAAGPVPQEQRPSPVKAVKEAADTGYSGSCSVWTDGTTFGDYCPDLITDYFTFPFFRAEASCTPTETAIGIYTTYEWSYAYCSEDGTDIQDDTGWVTLVS